MGYFISQDKMLLKIKLFKNNDEAQLKMEKQSVSIKDGRCGLLSTIVSFIVCPLFGASVFPSIKWELFQYIP